jgi:dephospho-CoA kinase
MKVVAVTGGIAGGKSTVIRMLGELGATIHSADEDARAVLAPGSPTLAAVLEAFPEARAADGTIDRAALGARIFGDAEARTRLNALMHPAIRVRMREAIDAARASTIPGVLAYEVPLLYEGGLETWFDWVIAVLASPAHQAQRLQAREAAAGRMPLTPEAIAERLSAQMPPEEKARRADFVVRTDVPLEETRAQAARVWEALSPP